MSDLASLFIRVDSSGVVTASKDLDKLTGASKQAEKATTSAAASVGKYISAAAATAAVMQLIRQSVMAFMDAEKATLKMAMAMKNQGDFSRAALEDLKDYAAQLQKVTAYEDDATLSLMGNLKSYGMTNAEVKKATKIAMDFASAKQAEGMTATTAAELLGKAYAGNTMMLSRYGIIIGETKDKSEKFNLVLKQLENRFGGSAQAELLTYAGQWQRLKNQWSDIQEFLGLAFLKSIQAVQVAAGLLGVTFLTSGAAIIGILRAIISPLAVILEGMAWLQEKAGNQGAADAMRAIANAAKNAQENINKSKEGMLAWTSTNWDNLKSFDGIETAIDKMGKTGKRTTYDTANGTDDAAAAAKKLREEWEKTAATLQANIDKSGLSEFEAKLYDIRAEAEKLRKQFKGVSGADKKIGEDERIKTEQVYTDEAKRLAESRVNELAKEFAAKKEMADQELKDSEANAEAVKKFHDDYVKMVNDVAQSYSELSGYEDQYRDFAFAAIDEEAKRRNELYKDDVAWAKWAADEKAKLEYDLFKKKSDYLSQGFGDLSTAFEGISKMYGEGSEEAKKWQQASEAMLIAQKAVAVVQAVAAIANQGLGDPYTAFARIAAMAAAMGALLATIGESVGGGTAAASAPKTYNYGGSAGPLGAETGTESKSLENSLGLVEDSLDNMFNLQDTKLTKIYNELRSLNQNITGLVSSIFRTKTGDYSSFGMETGDNFIGAQDWLSNQDNFDKMMGVFAGDPARMFGLGKFDPLGYFLSDLVGGWVGKAAGKIFGGGTETTLQQGGIEFGNVLVKSVMDGMSVSAKQFALYKIEEDGGWFHSDSTSWETRYAALNDDVVNMLTKMFDSIGTTLVTVAEGLGTSIQAAENYIFKSAQLNLKGMDAEEMSKALSNYFSEMADQAASDLFGTIIKEYQKVNEALFETAVRLVRDKTTVMNVLSATGHGMEQITTSVTKTRQAITDEWTKWEADRLKWSSSFIGKIATAFGGSYRVPEPDKYYTQTYNEITSNAQALIELSESLIELAGGLDKLTESAESYYTAFYSEAQQIAMLKGQLSGAFAEMERAFPATRDGFRGVVEGLDLTTQAGKEAYVAMLNMAESADKYYSYIEELADKRMEMEIDLLKLQGDAVGALAKERAGELEEMDASLKTFQQLIYAQEDFNDLLDKATSLLDQWRSMESQLLELQGNKVGALAVKRQDELDALDESLRPLQELIYAQEDLNNARATEITAVNNLITAQGQVVSELRQVVSELQGYVDKLKSARESMKMEGMKFAAEQVVSARLAFNAVLGQARMGDLSGIGTVDNAMAKLIENANSPKAFQTKQEYEENYYRTYNDIAELEKLAGTQLSTEEQTLNTLKDQLKVLNQIAGNTDNADLSVQDAQNAVDLAHADVIAKQAALEQARAQYEATRQAFVTMEEVVNSINGNNSQLTMSISEMTTALLEAKQAVVDATAGWATYQANQTAADAAAEQARIEALAAKHEAEAQAEADALLAKQIADAKTAADALAKQQAPKASILFWNIMNGISMADIFPSGFAEGGSFAGGYRIVGENGPELEYTGPSQITSNASSKALLDNSEVVKELKSLREDIKAYGYAIAKNTGKSAKVSDRWDIDGLPAERTIT